MVQTVKNPPATWETWVRFPGWEDLLEKGTATHCSILAWRIPWTVLSMELQRVGHDFPTKECGISPCVQLSFLMVNFCSLLQTDSELFLFKFILREYNFFFFPAMVNRLLFSIQQRFAESQPYQSLMET